MTRSLLSAAILLLALISCHAVLRNQSVVGAKTSGGPRRGPRRNAASTPKRPRGLQTNYFALTVDPLIAYKHGGKGKGKGGSPDPPHHAAPSKPTTPPPNPPPTQPNPTPIPPPNSPPPAPTPAAPTPAGPTSTTRAGESSLQPTFDPNSSLEACTAYKNQKDFTTSISKVVNFVYELSVPEDKDVADVVPKLEGRVKGYVLDNLLVCGDDDRRSLQVHHRRLPVDGFSSEPLDTKRDGFGCSLSDDIDGATCWRMNGGFTLYLTEGNPGTSREVSAERALELLRAGFNGVSRRMLADASLLSDEDGILGLRFVGGVDEFGGELPAGVPAGLATREEPLDDDDKSLAAMGIVLIVAAAVLLLLLLLAARKRQTKDSKAIRKLELKDDEMLVDDDENTASYREGSLYDVEIDNEDATTVGTSSSWRKKRAAHVVGEEDSVYSKGLRSLRSSDSAYLDELAGAYEVSYRKNSDKDAVFATPSRLGRNHSGMNVHQCSSATCDICDRQRSSGPIFIQAESESVASGMTPGPASPTRFYTTNDTVDL